MRCPRCNKLLVRVRRPALVTLDLRCGRCRLGYTTDVHTSTAGSR